MLAGLDLLIRHAPPTLRLVLSAGCPPRPAAGPAAGGGRAGRRDLGGPGLHGRGGRRVLRHARPGRGRLRPGRAAPAHRGLDGRPAAGRDERQGQGAGGRPDHRHRRGRAARHRLPLGRGARPGSPPETRLFLLRTSITGRDVRRPGRHADRASPAAPGRWSGSAGRTASSRRWATDHAARTGYHPLLRDVLAAERSREIPHEVPILLRRAARWHAAHDRPIDAVRSAAAGRGLGLRRAHAGRGRAAALVRSGADRRWSRCCRLFPAERRADDPAVAAALAAARLWNGDPDGAAHHLDGAQRALGRCAQAERRVIEPRLAALRVMQAASRAAADPGLLAQAWSLAEQAQATAGTQPEHRALGLLWFALGIGPAAPLGDQRGPVRAEPRRPPAHRGQPDRAAGPGPRLAGAGRGLVRRPDRGREGPRRARARRPPGAATRASRAWPALASAQLSLARDDLGGASEAARRRGRVRGGPAQVPGEPHAERGGRADPGPDRAGRRGRHRRPAPGAAAARHSARPTTRSWTRC